MSTVSSDYVNSSGSAGCNYTSLASYNAPYQMGVPPQGKQISGTYIVPAWGASGYDSLTSTVSNCSGYNSITSAYGADAPKCQTTYTTSLCGGGGMLGGCGAVAPAQKSSCCAQYPQDPACAKKESYMRRY